MLRSVSITGLSSEVGSKSEVLVRNLGIDIAVSSFDSCGHAGTKSFELEEVPGPAKFLLLVQRGAPTPILIPH
jgi:hypothetical protein